MLLCSLSLLSFDIKIYNSFSYLTLTLCIIFYIKYTVSCFYYFDQSWNVYVYIKYRLCLILIKARVLYYIILSYTLHFDFLHL